MKALPILISTAALAICPTSPATTVASWNFNALSIGSASTPGTGGVPTSISADTGSATLDLTGWTGTVDDFAGTTTNSQGGDPAGASLSLIAGSGLSGNGGVIVLSFSLSTLSDPTLSFATQGTGTGFISNQLAWSVNGSDFSNFATTYSPASSYTVQSFDLSSVDTLDGAANVWLRLTLDGASGTSGNNRIDNVVVSAIPEPKLPMILSITGILIILQRRR